jgi:glycosyltransferase involved in cell wall biosynthesis
MISVIVTVKNEGDNLHFLLDSLCNQTCPPDEIIVVDGGSSDNTLDVLYTYAVQLPLLVLCYPGCNISEGRNHAIEAACGDIIAATDAGLCLAREWVEAITAPLLDDPQLQVVGGFFEADAHSTFELAMGAAVGRLVDEIDVAAFLPGSRSIAFRKLAWLAVGGYPEWLDYGEDMLFMLRLRERYRRIAFAPLAVVHFRPRPSLPAFFKQYYLYARGDGKADFWRLRHAARYATYCVTIPLIFAEGMFLHPAFWLLLVLGASLYLHQPYRRLSAAIRKTKAHLITAAYAALLLPIIIVTGDMAKMMGYPAGVWWRSEYRVLKAE